MIEIKLAQLRAPGFSQAYQKLMKTEGLSQKVAYHVARVGALLEVELKAAEQAHQQLVQKWAEFKNENGETFWKVPEEKLLGWTEANKSFHEAVATIPKNKIMLGDLEKANLSPQEYLVLEPVLNGFEVLEGGQNG